MDIIKEMVYIIKLKEPEYEKLLDALTDVMDSIDTEYLKDWHYKTITDFINELKGIT